MAIAVAFIPEHWPTSWATWSTRSSLAANMQIGHERPEDPPSPAI
jgi:hypothetical protein